MKQFYFITIGFVVHKHIRWSTKASLLYALEGFIGKQKGNMAYTGGRLGI